MDNPGRVGRLLRAAASDGRAGCIAGLVWSYFDKTDAAIVAKAIALPEVAKIECCDTEEGIELATSVPHEDVVAVSATLAHPKVSSTLRRVVQNYPRKRKNMEQLCVGYCILAAFAAIIGAVLVIGPVEKKKRDYR